MALIYNKKVNPIATKALSWRYYLLFVVILAQWLVVTWLFFPGTRGHSLEELDALFDGPVWGLRKAMKGGPSAPAQVSPNILELDSDVIRIEEVT